MHAFEEDNGIVNNGDDNAKNIQPPERRAAAEEFKQEMND